MAIKTTEKIEIKIQTEKKLSVYPVIAYLSLTKEKEEAYEAFKKERELENKAMEDAIEQRSKLSKKIGRLSQDLDYINDDLDDKELEDDDARALRKERRELSLKLRKLEDKLEAHLDEHDVASYKKLISDLVEDTAKFSFGMNIKEDEQSQALQKAMTEHNITYAVMVSEIGRLIGDASKKKKRRS